MEAATLSRTPPRSGPGRPDRVRARGRGGGVGENRRSHGRDGCRPGTELGGLGWFAVVWVTMMAAMMLPSIAPMVLAHARVQIGATPPSSPGTSSRGRPSACSATRSSRGCGRSTSASSPGTRRDRTSRRDRGSARGARDRPRLRTRGRARPDGSGLVRRRPRDGRDGHGVGPGRPVKIAAIASSGTEIAIAPSVMSFW